MRPEGISSACDGAAWRVDVGLAATESDAGKPHIAASQVLEIVQGEGGADTLKVRRPCFSCYPATLPFASGRYRQGFEE